MENVFINLLNISITASYLVVAVLLLRLIFKKAPKWLFCVLWALVGMRLVFPISLESALSLIPSTETVPSTIIYQQSPHINSGIPIVNDVVNPVISETFAPDPAASANPLQTLTILASWIWAFGLVLMLVYTLISYLRLRHKVSTATLFSGNIYQSEVVQSPFVLGIIKPKIYLPYNIADQDIGHVIAHERAHLKRKDHLIKPLAFLILSVYWFNPLMWVAYVLLCRDIELACDEKVIKELDRDARRSYSTALLNCSVNRRMIAACPLAFGEVGVKERIKSVMNYKKPAFWVIVLAVAACVVTTVCFMTNPKSDTTLSGKVFLGSEIKYNYVTSNGISGKQYCVTDDMVLYDFAGNSPELRYIGKLEKSDVTAEELTNQISGQERGTNNPTYTFNQFKEAYVAESVNDTGATVTTYVVIDERNDILIVTMPDYETMNEGAYILNVEQIEPIKDADFRNVFSSLLIRITKADYMGTSQVLESVQTYYWLWDEKDSSIELTDGLVCSTKGFDASNGEVKISLNRQLEWIINAPEKIAETDAFSFKLGEVATLRTADITGGTTYYSFDFVEENDVKYADNLKQKAVHTDYNGVNVYLSDNSSLDGNIEYVLENRTEKDIEYGSEYTVYRITDGKAVRCDTVGNVCWDAILYMQSAQSSEYTYFSTGTYNVTLPGVYRFEKTFNFAGEKEEYKAYFDFELMVTHESLKQENLDKAIDEALTSKYSVEKGSDVTFVSHVIIANESGIPAEGSGTETMTAYIWFAYEKYRAYGGFLEESGGGSNFAAITFDVMGDGSYVLKELWEPRDGSEHMNDVLNKFPDGSNIDEDVYRAMLVNDCYKQALAYFGEGDYILSNASTAYAGTSALAVKHFTELSENGDYIDQMSSIHYPVMKIETLEELESFATDYPLFKFGQSYNMAMGYPESSLNDIPSFYDEMQKYNGEFFEKHNLYIIYLSSDNSLVRHELFDVTVEKGKLTFMITSLVPETTVDKELGYFMLVTVNKAALANVTETDAYLAEEKIGKTYSFKKGGNESYFTLRADGTFDIVYSYSKSHEGTGKYTISGNNLILIDNDGEKFTFIKEREDIYIFDKGNSTSFHGEYDIPDEAAFEYVSLNESFP